MQNQATQQATMQELKLKRRKALNLVFREFESLDNGQTIKENIIDFLDGVMLTLIEHDGQQLKLSDFSTDLNNLTWIRDLVKKC